MAHVRTPDDFPRGTPLFAKCKRCGDSLPYPPVQIPDKPVPDEQPGRSMIVWHKYCITCAVRVVRRLKERDLVPDFAWSGNTETTNPYKEERRT